MTLPQNPQISQNTLCGCALFPTDGADLAIAYGSGGAESSASISSAVIALGRAGASKESWSELSLAGAAGEASLDREARDGKGGGPMDVVGTDGAGLASLLEGATRAAAAAAALRRAMGVLLARWAGFGFGCMAASGISVSAPAVGPAVGVDVAVAVAAGPFSAIAACSSSR